ncbi:hypothetical protein FISHEDRAFT_35099 [Fistulina hepatica ATCC 64428]|uniref:Uncharacterized protein n=1 Tax=Fistulina hepatica ATCC 64428 TaxID=1128425 RepID=A0A0D7AKW8_9AGAR|nr:hypothetical protein FISHEDRAFT_35099 [Fistulina hepatica ATCC 64428]
MEQNISGSIVEPFWADLPHCNIHNCMTPDVLHQLHQGTFKHILSWCQTLVSKKELDARIRVLLPCYGVRHFNNGLSNLSQVSGPERKHIERILLVCLVDIVPKDIIIAVRSILDFIYLAQYSSHDEITLGYLREALALWDRHKNAFIELGVRDHLNIPKFHSIYHYLESIERLGTTDNYNTEMFERLHIDMAKEGWRASNH